MTSTVHICFLDMSRGLPHVCWSSGGGEVEVEYLVVAVGVEVDGSRLVIV